MKIGIICAVDVELNPFLSEITDLKESKKAMLRFYEGNIHGVETVAVSSGMGKVNAAIATQILIDTYKADYIINTGTAGAVSHKLKILDTAVSTECAYHDADKNLLVNRHPYMENCFFNSNEDLIRAAENAAKQTGLIESTKFGRTVTGESFIEGEAKKQINELYEPLTTDMESAAVAHVCYTYGIPFISIRTVTDNASGNTRAELSANVEKASAKSAFLTIAVIKEALKFKKIRPVEVIDINECVSVIQTSFETVAKEFGITRDNAPRFTAYATDEERLAHNFYATPKYVCCENDRIIGYYSLSLLGNGECELNNLCVLPSHRNSGVGSYLLDHAEEMAKNAGCYVINIGIVEENKALRKWFEDRGFVHIAKNKFEFFPFTSGFMKKLL